MLRDVVSIREADDVALVGGTLAANVERRTVGSLRVQHGVK